MTETKTVRLDIDAYNILESVRDYLNAEKRRRGQAENAAFQDAVRFMRNYVPAVVLKKEKAQAQSEQGGK